jgi:PAS domain S-box-containing protein
MAMKKNITIFFTFLFGLVVLVTASGCTQNETAMLGPRLSQSPFATFRDVPGITPEQIAEIEELQRRFDYFEYGMILTTEAFINADNEVGGYSALFCEWLGDFFGIPFIPRVLSPVELFARLNNGDLDFSGNLTPTPERLRIYHMTNPIAERQYVTVRLKGSPPFSEILQERPLRYIFIENTPMIDFVRQVAEPGSFEPVFVLNDAAAHQMLQRGEADAYITTSIAQVFFVMHDDIIVEDFFPLLFNPVAMATANPELEVIISVVTKAQNNGIMPFFNYLYHRGNQDFRRFAIDTLLDETEKEFIYNNPVIPIAVFNASYPLSFWNTRENKWEGIFFDVMEEVSALTGLTFDVVHDNTVDRAVANQMLARGEVRLIPGVIWSRETADRFLWSQHLLLDDHYALISKTDFPFITINEIIHVSVGVARDSPHATIFRRWFPNHTNIVEFDGINQALDALTRGDVDVVMSEQRRVLQLTHLQELPDYKVNMVFNEPLDMRITFARDAEILRSIVDDALALVDIEGIIINWTQKTYDYRARIAEARLPWLIGAVSLALVIVVLLSVIFVRSSILAKKINSQKESLENAVMQLYLAMKAGKIHIWEQEINIDNPLALDNYTTWPDGFRHLIGYEDETDFPNRVSSLMNIIYHDDLPDVVDAFTNHIMDKTGNTPYSIEYRVKKRNGGMVNIHATCETIRDDQGDPQRVVGTIIDITETKNMVRNLEIAKEEAERQRHEAEIANRAKSEFLSHISHEIRTPMNAVLGTAEIQLQKEITSPEIEEAFNTIYGSGNLLLNIINDILDLSKIEAGKLEIIPIRYDIPSLIYDTMQLNLLRYDSKPITFDLKIHEDTPLDMLGDELRIKQVLNNIISNAFKYTDSGRVELSVFAEANDISGKKTDDYTACTLVIQVIDTGHGMTEEQVNKLFEAYTRFNVDTNRTTVGTGLGMHITKRLLDAMNGKIQIESKYGEGSVFTIKIPQTCIGNKTCGPDMANQLCSSRFKSTLKLRQSQTINEYMPYGRVLIVDDVESNLYVAKGMMLPYGLHIETVLSGFEAVEKVKDGNIYDIIFMDHMMPKMNGLEAARILREMGYTHPIVALTANAVMGSSHMFLSNGFDGYISKPIDIRELNNSLNRLVRDKQPPEVIEAAKKEVNTANPTTAEPGKNNITENKIKEASLRDIQNAVTVLKDILSVLDTGGDADIELFTTTVHGMKSALANINEKELSKKALDLEMIGQAGKTNAVLTETPPFINTLEGLIQKLKPAEETFADEISGEDKILLHEKLAEIKTACEQIKKKAAKTVLNELMEKTWPRDIKNLLDDVSDDLLSGEFKNAANRISTCLSR